jgi:hypothetical protein
MGQGGLVTKIQPFLSLGRADWPLRWVNMNLSTDSVNKRETVMWNRMRGEIGRWPRSEQSLAQTS